jgi:hypothetical protein
LVYVALNPSAGALYPDGDEMDKKIVGLVGAMASLASMDSAQAATESALSPTKFVAARTYGELLDPIPNAVALLRAADEAGTSAPRGEGDVQVAQYYHHHHHHHHHRYRRSYHHHHHHHHHHRYYRGY